MCDSILQKASSEVRFRSVAQDSPVKFSRVEEDGEQLDDSPCRERTPSGVQQGRLGLEEDSGRDFEFADGAENLDTQIKALH